MYFVLRVIVVVGVVVVVVVVKEDGLLIATLTRCDVCAALIQNYEKLCKRAYLGKYLVRIEPPQEFMQDETLGDLVEKYKELQGEFKATHKTFDKNKTSMSRPGAELRAEIQQVRLFLLLR